MKNRPRKKKMADLQNPKNKIQDLAMSKIEEESQEYVSNYESNASLQGPIIKSSIGRPLPKKKDDSSDSDIDVVDGGGLYYDFDKPKNQATTDNKNASPPDD